MIVSNKVKHKNGYREKKNIGNDRIVSIITIVFNGEDGLNRTIQSLANQTCKDFEYIIIDGGSTDSTLDIIKNNEKYIDYWYSAPDKGISDAFNKGIDKASGDIIGILNAGDLFSNNTIEIVVKNFIDKVDYIYGNSVIRKKEGQFDRIITPSNIKNFPYGGMPLQHSSLFVRESVYRQIGGFDLNYKTTMDFEFLLRVIDANYRGAYVNSILSVYYRGGISDSSYIDGYIEVLKASIKYSNSYLKILAYFVFGVTKTYIRRLVG